MAATETTKTNTDLVAATERPATNTDLLVEGREALLAGEKARARALLQRAVRDDPANAEAWLWLSGTHSDPEEMAYCLNQVLRYDPDNPQAQEGLAWIAETFGPRPAEPAQSDEQIEEVLSEAPEAASVQALPQRRTQTRTLGGKGIFSLVEAGGHVAAVGAVLGLVRLLLLLRPGRLLLLRSAAGPVEPIQAFAVALSAALLHAIAALAIWYVLSRATARLRNDRQGDLFDSLLRTGAVFKPGYLAAALLPLIALALNWSEQRWLPVMLLCWIVLGGVLLIGARRFARQLDGYRIGYARRGTTLLRLLLPVLITAVLGLGLAGLLVEGLLRM